MSGLALAASACPACIEALGSGVYEGYLWGMGVMMAMPFFLVLVVGGGILHARRKALRQDVERFPAAESAPTGGSERAGDAGGAP